MDALSIARSLLGDDGGTKWTDPILMPKIKQAHGEMVAKFVLNGLRTEIKTSTRLTLTAGSTNLGILQPTDIIRIIKLQEVAPTDSIDRAIDMTLSDPLPRQEVSQTLRYWDYRLGVLEFLGSTVDRDVIIEYFRNPAAPTKVTDPLDFPQSEIYLGPRAAALTVMVQNRMLFQMANQMAEENLSKLVRSQVKGDQNLPVRRRPFSYMLRRGARFR